MIQKLLEDLKDGCFGMRSSNLILLVHKGKIYYYYYYNYNTVGQRNNY